MLGSVDEALLLPERHAGGGATVRGVGAGPHFHEDEGAVSVAQDQVHLARPATRAGRDSIIALLKAQACAQQVGERRILGRLAT